MTRIFSELEQRAEKAGTNLTAVCEKANIAPSTIWWWQHHEPKTIAKYLALIAELDKIENIKTKPINIESFMPKPIVLDADSDNASYPIDEWIKKVYELGAMLLEIQPNNTKSTNQLELRRMVMILAIKKFNQPGLRFYSLEKIGHHFAKVINRRLPFNHSTVIHAQKKHKIAMENPEKGYWEYVNSFTQFERLVIERGFITDTNEK